MAKRYSTTLIGGNRRFNERPKDRAILINRQGEVIVDRAKYSPTASVSLDGLTIGHILCDELIVQGVKADQETRFDILVHPIGVGMFSQEQFDEWITTAKDIAVMYNAMVVGTSHADGSFRNSDVSISLTKRMPMETERLKLRSFERNDAMRIKGLAGDYEIAKTTLNIPHPYPEGAAEAFITRSHDAAKEGTHYDFAIVRKQDNELVGAIALGITPRYKRAEIAYWTGRPYWGKGYMTEAARRVLKFGFEDLDLNRIYAFAFTSNPASSTVMKKIGMTYEGTLVQHVLKWDQFYDLDAYGILRQTYHELGS